MHRLEIDQTERLMQRRERKDVSRGQQLELGLVGDVAGNRTLSPTPSDSAKAAKLPCSGPSPITSRCTSSRPSWPSAVSRVVKFLRRTRRPTATM